MADDTERQNGVLAFLAQDAEKRVFWYGNATVRKEDQHDEILRFVEEWNRARGIGLRSWCSTPA